MSVCKYLAVQYKDVIFSAEASGLNKSKAQAGKSKMQRSSSKLPDLWIPEARGGYFGLFIEFKAKNPYLKDNSLSKDAHVQAQAQMLEKLRTKGYQAQFEWDFYFAKGTIDHYMSQPKTTLL